MTAPRPDDRAQTVSSTPRPQKLWRMRQAIEGTVAETYLRRTVGYGGAIPATLGFMPAKGDRPPLLIAAMGMASEPEPGILEIDDADVKDIHVTPIGPDGGMSRMAPFIMERGVGAPVMIASVNDLGGLAICERIETALLVHQRTGLGAWASGHWGNTPALAPVVPAYVDTVTIFYPSRRGAALWLSGGLARRGIAHTVVYRK